MILNSDQSCLSAWSNACCHITFPIPPPIWFGFTKKILDDVMMGKTVTEADERFGDKISELVHNALEQSKDIEITSGFRGFINSIFTAPN